MFYRFYEDLETKGNKAELDYALYNMVDNAEDLSRFEIGDYEPLFNPVQLKRGSSEVDIIGDSGSTGGAGFIVSKRLKLILEDMNLPKHRFYHLTYKRKDGALIDGHYYFFQYVLEHNFEWIDFDNSTFYIRQEIGDQRMDVTVQNAKELVELIDVSHDHFKRVLFDSLTFNSSYSEADFFELYQLNWLPIISERLKNRLEEENITGLEDFRQLNIQLPQATS
ncbi:MAG: hypothetical protein JJ975_03770 [Bacteroidia bacterium]|nr:hypothetical protein [Bacteroidia bacterium]